MLIRTVANRVKPEEVALRVVVAVVTGLKTNRRSPQ